MTNPTRTAAAVAVAAGIVTAAPVATADDTAPVRPEHSLDAGRVDVAAISLAGETMRLGAEDGNGTPRDPESLVYTTDVSGAGVEIGWDTGGIEPGRVFGDSVSLRLRAAEGPAEFRADPLRLPVGENGTTTWTFPLPGRYTVTFAVEANLLTGEPVTTEERYTVEVRAPQADAPPSSSPPSTPPAVQPDSASQPRVASAPEAKALPAPLAAAQPPPVTPGKVVLAEGHVDAVAPRLLDGRVQIQVKDGVTVGQTGGRVHWREPRDVVFHVKPTAKAKLPGDSALAFLGKPGDEIFLLPQQQQAGILWTGWSTEELRADQVAGPVTWRLTKVDGPGPFGIFTTGSFGASTAVFNSVDGLPDSHSIALGTHAHANWGFAKQGVYRLTFDTTVKLTGGQTVTDTEVYTFAVGDVDPNNVSPGGSGNGGGGNGGGASGAGGGSAGGGSRDQRLAHTGVNGVLPMTAGGVALLGLGGAALVLGRKRRKSENR
ncbi:choice-of-anchor M domain-containing protein [Kibdelosporangium persicum]|uniref:choice-of-anchor M domain-containing protein n=1 Tax=Kibdelosporangium persicum TaxID=2698649 RepID=UPI001565AAAB|nr:choice-of-anchor M domain-containing protein [Kibdelosporangium persicum]